jgi:oligosaccharide repeat unit polymerase
LILIGTIGWYLFLMGVIWTLQRLTHCFSKLNIFTLFSFFLILRHGITVPFDYNVNEWFAGIVVSKMALQRFYISLILMYVSLLLGIYLGKRWFGSSVIVPETFRTDMFNKRVLKGFNQPLFLIVLVISVGLVILYRLNTGFSISNFLLGQMSADEYMASRQQASEVTSYSNGFLLLLTSYIYYGLFPFLVYTLFFLEKRSAFWKTIFIIVLGVGLLAGLSSGQKSPALFLLLGLAVAYFLRRGNISVRITNWRIWIFLFMGIFFTSYLYRMQYPSFDYAQAFQALLFRLAREYNRILQLYFEFYPDIQPHMFGTSSNLIGSLLGVNRPISMLPEHYIPQYYLGPTYVNTWNTSWVGNAWVDFGFLGVIIESLILGLLLQWYARWFSRATKTALVMGAQVALIMSATKTSEVAFFTSLLTFGLISVFILYFLLRRVSTGRTPITSESSISYASERKSTQ